MPEKKTLGLRLNLIVLAISRRWLRYITIALAIYVSLPFIAPTLMRVGLDTPANFIYSVYSPFCHQFPFRSFFLYGDQPVYPRESVPGGYDSYEERIATLPEFRDYTEADYFTSLEWTLDNKGFNGNETLGYKVALCERDIFIYMALLLGAVIYSQPYVRRHLRPMPLWLYVILGLGPIGMDGFSQLLGYPPFEFWPPRETLPEFRVLTGFVFGLMTAWLGFPYIDLSMRDTRMEVEAKLAQKGITIPQ